MHKDLTQTVQSSFLSCEKDINLILQKIFYASYRNGMNLKKLLMINTKDCLDNPSYDEDVKDITPLDLKERGYIRLSPRLEIYEDDEIKNYILISLDQFTTNDQNPQFRDCNIIFHVFCHSDYWDIGDYRQRPLKIIGCIDGVLDNTRLTGIGKLEFIGCTLLTLSAELSGYSLMYRAVHGSDDRISNE